MVYVFDSNSLSQIFLSFYPSVFRSFWITFEELIKNEQILSTREVKKELEKKNFPSVPKWISDHPQFFKTPNEEELSFISEIYLVRHFQQNLELKKRLQEGAHADPFVIAKAKVIEGSVVTEERYTPNGTSIPNICRHFNIDCLNLEEFLKRNNCQW